MSIGELSAGAAAAARESRSAPVIVLAYAGSGADQLRSALAAFGELACTERTGILPLCHHAVTTWQTVDGNPGGLSPLAAASVRALTSGLMTAVAVRHGGRRWCEFASAPPAAARSFARICPQARFLIIHRRADTAARAIISASPWGLEGPEFAPYVSAQPASPVAALASYWAAHTTQQLEFEQAHPASCHRVRIEDLTADKAQALQGISGFLGLDPAGAPPSLTGEDNPNQHPGDGVPATGLPLDRIPPSLLARVNDLHGTLGYPPITAAAQRSGEGQASRP